MKINIFEYIVMRKMIFSSEKAAPKKLIKLKKNTTSLICIVPFTKIWSLNDNMIERLLREIELEIERV